MKLTFWGGVDEIGGNKILLEDKRAAVFLDFGKSYHEASKYFEEFLNPRVIHGLKDYLSLGLLPVRKGIYREDLTGILKKEGERNLYASLGVTSGSKPVVDGVLLSHGHLDHAGYISFLNPQIPVYASKNTMAVLKAFSVSRPKSLENEILELSWREVVDPRKRKRSKREFRIIEDQKPFFIKNLEIIPIAIDHSVPGACMFLIKTSVGNLLYSGDFRLSEITPDRRKKIFAFLRKSRIKIFICEGTRIQEQSILREKDVYQKALAQIQKVKGLVAVDYSIGDIARFKTILKIAKKTKRRIALPYNYFNYLSVMEREGVLQEHGISRADLKNITLYAKEKIYLQKWELDLIKNYRTCYSSEIRKNQKKFMLVLNFYQVQELIDIKPDEKSYYLRAITEPHSEEMEISEQRFVNWIKHFRMQGLESIVDADGHEREVFARAHISGHISGKELGEFIAEIQPEMIIPIHTEFPEEFRNWHQHVHMVRSGETFVLK